MGCIQYFYRLFYYMEDNLILDATDEHHLLALHYVFLPRVQENINNFIAAYIHRPLRTEQCRTPLQLWISGHIQHDLTALMDVSVFNYSLINNHKRVSREIGSADLNLII